MGDGCKKENSVLRIFKKAFYDSLPVMAGYGTMGFAAGVLLAVHGGIAMPEVWAFFSSAAFISGPLQYLFVDWVRASVPVASVLLIVFCVNLRYSLYGLSLLETFRAARFWERMYLITGITDETYALEVACTLSGRKKVAYCVFLTALDHFYWVAGVTAGAFACSLVKVPAKGIDFAMTALFLVILAEQLREKANRIPALIGGLSSIAVFVLLSSFRGASSARGDMLIPSMALMVASFLAMRRKIEGAQS